MKAILNLSLEDLAETRNGTEEMRHCAEGIWGTISKYVTKYVTVEKDAVFNDPNWPHLWDKK